MEAMRVMARASQLRIDRAPGRKEDAIPPGPAGHRWGRSGRGRGFDRAAPADFGPWHRLDDPGAVERQHEIADRGPLAHRAVRGAGDHRLDMRVVESEIA